MEQEEKAKLFPGISVEKFTITDKTQHVKLGDDVIPLPEKQLRSQPENWSNNSDDQNFHNEDITPHLVRIFIDDRTKREKRNCSLDRLYLRSIKSKVKSRENLNYRPEGGDIAIFHEKLEFKKRSRPKINSWNRQFLLMPGEFRRSRSQFQLHEPETEEI